MIPRYAYKPGRPAPTRLEVQRLDASHAVVRFGAHAHDFFEMVVFDRGGGRHVVAGGDVEIVAGQVWLLRPGIPHDLGGIGDAAGWLLLLGPETNDVPSGTVDIAPWMSNPLVAPFYELDAAGRPIPLQLDPAQLERWIDRLDAIEREATEGLIGWEYSTHALVRLLLVDLARTAPTTASASEPLVEQALAIVNDQFSFRLKPAAIARQLSVTPGYLTELVRRRTGRPLGDWITERRLAEARVLLAESRRSISEISDVCGYGDVGRFSRQFRQVHGVSPSEWRRAVLDPAPSSHRA